MKNQTAIAIIVVALVALFAIVLWSHSHPNTVTPPSGGDTSNTLPPAAYDKSISDGTITIGYSSDSFGLATTKSQILVTSYIPPCSENFNYCLYYTGAAYTGTNFESAGIRMQKRDDLATEQVCLNTPPDGFSADTIPSGTASADAYSSSVFGNVGDAGAGHYASGSLYRLFVRDTASCYEFETRIGATQFANYPAGTIKEFTTADQAALKAQLDAMIQNISVGGMKGLFPKV